MAVQRIDQVRNREAVAQPVQELQQQRLNLFNSESFERITSLKLGDSRVDIPHMSKSDQATAAQLFGSIPADQQATVQATFDNLTNLIFAEGKNNPEGVNANSFSAGLTDALNDSLEVWMTTGGVDQADQAVQGVMFGAMVGIESELGDFAANLKDKLNLSAEMRTDVTEFQTELSDSTWTDSPDDKREFTWREIETDDAGNVTGFTEHTESLSKADAQAKLDDLEMQRATLGDFTEMMKFDLQRMSQDYQQALNTLSNLLKSQHDSLMSIIRNAKAS